LSLYFSYVGCWNWSFFTWCKTGRLCIPFVLPFML
jgi:hypothetical protein